MKKLFLIAISFCGATFVGFTQNDSTLAPRKIGFGIRAGINLNYFQQIVTKDYGRDIRSVEGPGFHIGGAVIFPSSQKNLRSEWGALFSVNASDATDSSKAVYYLDVPIIIAYRLPLSDKMGTFFHAGINLGIGLAGWDAAFNKTGRFNFGYKFGLGLHYDRFSLVTDYNLGLFNLSKEKENQWKQWNTLSITFGWDF